MVFGVDLPPRFLFRSTKSLDIIFCSSEIYQKPMLDAEDRQIPPDVLIGLDSDHSTMSIKNRVNAVSRPIEG